MKKLDPYNRWQHLWNYYPNNDDLYHKIFFDVCQDLIYLKTFGMDCSLYNSTVEKICRNGQSDLDNFENFNVNCSSMSPTTTSSSAATLTPVSADSLQGMT